MKNLSTGIEASTTGESLNSGDPAVHPAARHKSDQRIGIFRPPCTIILSLLVEKWVVAAEQNGQFRFFFNVFVTFLFVAVLVTGLTHMHVGSTFGA